MKKDYVESASDKKRYPDAEDYNGGYEKILETFEEADDDDDMNPVVWYILNDPDLPNITDITIGEISEEMDNESYEPIIDMFAENSEKFAHVDTLFIGDSDSDGWHGDYSSLFAAMPQLKSLTIRGSSKDLSFGSSAYLPNLKHLEIICRGLSSDLLKDISKLKLPNLEELILWIGKAGNLQSFDGDVSDITPLLSKKLFPKLRVLGLLYNEIGDDIAIAVMASDLLPQLEELHLDAVSLSDKGGQALLDNVAKIAHLKYLNLDINCLSLEMMEKLEGLGIKISMANFA
ncbi:MAG: hypothetical protein LBV04_01605 [Deferribacteraceae bacterium]|nr:hypothetical protein [Deferribacteraceae bacterium]